MHQPPRLTTFARDFRKASTEAEKRIWFHLRNGKLDGLKFRRQRPIGPYIIDFYCDAVRIATELDGGQHAEPEAIAHDSRRTAFLKSQKIAVVRFWDCDALRDTDAVIKTILREARSQMEKLSQTGPHPSPLPEYRERGPEAPLIN